MLPKHNRLKNKKDFDNVFKKGKKIAGKLIFLKALKNKLDFSRFGFIVSLKISKKAVVRNKIKRRLRAVIKENILNIKIGLDIIIIAKPEILDKEYKEIKNDLENLLQNL